MYSDNSGLVTSPNYPYSYPNHLKCQLRIQASEGNVISLIPYVMDTEIDTSRRCLDKVDLFDGVDSTAERLSNTTFCGRILPPSLVSSSTDLMIKFTSDFGKSHTGFAFTYIAHPPSSKFFEKNPYLLSQLEIL